MVKEMIRQRALELGIASGQKGDAKLGQAAGILEELMTGPDFADFLTLASYDLLD